MAETELSSLVVKLEADLEGFKSGLASGQQAVTSASNKMADAVDKFSDRTTGSMLNFGRILDTSIGVALGSLAAQVVSSLGSIATSFTQTLVGEGVKGAQEAEDAVIRLNFALAQAGQYSQGTSQAIQDLAGELQTLTKFEDDAIVKTAAQIESLGRLDREGLSRATRAALDLSAALGIDLSTATQLVGKAAAGEVGSFGRLGIVISEGSTRAETFAKAMDQLEKRFGGAAASQVNTYSGSVAQLKNNFGNFSEEIGNAIVKNQSVINTIKAINSIVQEFSTYLNKNQTSIKEWVAQGLISAIDAIAGFVTVLDAAQRIGVVVFETLKGAAVSFGLGVVTVIGGTVAIIDELLKKLPGVGQYFGATSDAVQLAMGKMAGSVQNSAANITTALTSPSQGSEKITEVLGRLRYSAEQGMGSISTGAANTIAPLNQTRSAIETLTAAQIALGDAGKKLFAELTAFNPAQNQKEQLELAKAQLEAHLITVQEYNALETQSFQAKLDAQLAALTAAHEQEKLSDLQLAEAKIELEKKAVDERAKLDLKQKQLEQKQLQERLSYTSQFFGSLSSLQRTKSRELFEIGKAAATAQAIIDGIAGVQKTLASVPAPFNFALAAAQAAAAAINVAQIQSQQMPLARGIDSVPGIGSRDNFPALLAPGERVVPKQTNQDLTQFIQGQEQVPGLLRAMISRMDQLENQVIVNVGGKEILDAVNDQLLRGRRLALP